MRDDEREAATDSLAASTKVSEPRGRINMTYARVDGGSRDEFAALRRIWLL